ncbi:sensor histidine kinase [Pseudonocardia sp. CA-107938]|uniref:sensor histidine kinase n=1 Tax=Pseudonocardia sp. CA-107938 TaxID=3240021 RepID=UPI003D8DA26E
MRWALAALTVAAFLTFGLEATTGPVPVLALGVGLLYTAVAIVGYRWVDEYAGSRRRSWAIAFVGWQLLIGYATFGTEPGTGATLLICVLIAQTVHLLGVLPAVVLVAVTPLVHLGMDMGEGLRAGAGSLIAGAFTAVVVVFFEREQRARAELADAHRQLRGYAEQAEELATTRERNRVARDIHDGLGHHLTVVQMQVQAARAVLPDDPARADAVLAKAQQQAGEALAEVRRSVAALREPRTLPALPDAVAALVAESSAAGVATELELVGTARELDSERTEALYRAVQEGLTNVRKHADAGSVAVRLDFTAADTVAVEVRDDGRGADGGTPGFGLVGLRERAEALGGSLERTSVPGAGTTLRVAVPG